MLNVAIILPGLIDRKPWFWNLTLTVGLKGGSEMFVACSFMEHTTVVSLCLKLLLLIQTLPSKVS